MHLEHVQGPYGVDCAARYGPRSRRYGPRQQIYLYQSYSPDQTIYNITRPGAEGAEEKNAFSDGEMPERTRRNEVLQVASNPVIWHGLQRI